MSAPMSITVSARDANQRFAEILGKAVAGETVIITKRGEPVATLTRYRAQTLSPERKAAWDRLLARLGTVSVPEEMRDWKFNRDELYDDEDGNPRGSPKGMR
jgi:prevent-host-death family protein